MARKVLGKRALLNLPGFESTAAIVAEIAEVQYGLEVSIAISDCSRTVNLTFSDDFDDDDKFANNLHKVDTMIDCLKAFRRGLMVHRRRAVGG